MPFEPVHTSDEEMPDDTNTAINMSFGSEHEVYQDDQNLTFYPHPNPTKELDTIITEWTKLQLEIKRIISVSTEFVLEVREP